MTGFIEDMLLRQEGLSDADIAAVNAALPDVQALDAALQAQWPRISKLAPLFLRLFNIVIAKQRTLT